MRSRQYECRSLLCCRKGKVFLCVLTVTLCPAFRIAMAEVSPPMPPPMTMTDKLLVGIATIPTAHSPTLKGWCVVATSGLQCSRPNTLIRAGVSAGVSGDVESFETVCIGATEYIMNRHLKSMPITIRPLRTCLRIKLACVSRPVCHTDAHQHMQWNPVRHVTSPNARGNGGIRWGRTVVPIKSTGIFQRILLYR